MKVKLSDINGAASFDSLGPILSTPVAFAVSMFLRSFSTFSCAIKSIENEVFFDSFSSQNRIINENANNPVYSVYKNWKAPMGSLALKRYIQKSY